MDAPGANVRQKAGLNRVILNTGWGGLCRKLEYKTAVEVVNAAYTSQTCHAGGCGEPAQPGTMPLCRVCTRGQCGRERRIEHIGIGDRRNWTWRGVGFGHPIETSTHI